MTHTSAHDTGLRVKCLFFGVFHPMKLRGFVDNLLPPLLRAYPNPSATQEQAFTQYASVLTRQLGLLTAALMLVFTLAWWPLDPVVLPDTDAVRTFANLRMRAAVLEGLALALLGLTRPRPHLTPAMAVGLYAALMASFGYSLGAATRPELSWFANAVLGVIPSAFLPMQVRWRVPATIAIAAGLAVGFFGAFPHNLSISGADTQLSFLGFAVVFTMLIGEFSTRVMRRSFFEADLLDARNQELAELTSSLSSTVEARTASLRGLALHLDRVQENERIRLSRDLHDEFGQHLTAMRYTVTRMEERAHRDPALLVPMVEDLDALVSGMSDSVRAMVASMQPRFVRELGLVASAQWLRDQLNGVQSLECTLDIQADAREQCARLAPTRATVLFRVLQEACTNVRRHADASEVQITIAAAGENICVSVRDNGSGFDTDAPVTGFGLLGLRERLADSEGTLTVDSIPGNGTLITATLPIVAAPGVPDEMGDVA